MKTFYTQKIAIIALAGLLVSNVTSRAATFTLLSPEVVAINGRIGPGDCDRWKTEVRPTLRTVVLHSPVGRVTEGECISRSIASRDMRTFVQGKCASICFLLFAAGAERWACDGARVGVHRPSHTITHEEPRNPKLLRGIIEHTDRYGVPLAIQDKLADTSPDSMYWLNDLDFESMNVKRC